ncbi:MAG: hypothetical protein CVV10_07050, partial [Gammaproteobacteria bacterium HGW-Gammaproteobacteria-14]
MALLNLRRKSPGGDSELLARSLAEQQDLSRLLQDTADIVVFTQTTDGKLLSINRHGRWLSGISETFSNTLLFVDLLHEPPRDLQQRLA